MCRNMMGSRLLCRLVFWTSILHEALVHATRVHSDLEQKDRVLTEVLQPVDIDSDMSSALKDFGVIKHDAYNAPSKDHSLKIDRDKPYKPGNSMFSHHNFWKFGGAGAGMMTGGVAGGIAGSSLGRTAGMRIGESTAEAIHRITHGQFHIASHGQESSISTDEAEISGPTPSDKVSPQGQKPAKVASKSASDYDYDSHWDRTVGVDATSDIAHLLKKNNLIATDVYNRPGDKYQLKADKTKPMQPWLKHSVRTAGTAAGLVAGAPGGFWGEMAALTATNTAAEHAVAQGKISIGTRDGYNER
eukprot:TRINITY_DN94585_c0_g1_i1.p1 TRINITY_DN94585_c0_g1~~TRINITY_DN94585_c0_g1_i1.p1  ORF type:complete len:302 (+),score=46.59 TRINITY_DN94585_c0_g1_i1:48-953(+)